MLKLSKNEVIILLIAFILTAASVFTFAAIAKDKPPEVLAKALPVQAETEYVKVLPVSSVDEIRISPVTKMVYQYYYTGDGHIETVEEEPPYFLLDMSRENLEKTYSDWSLIAFSEKEVVLRKNVSGKSNQYYVIGVHDGFVAVFYADESAEAAIKEITDMPVTSLPKEEQIRLKEGILVEGEDELLKLLEDYGS